MRNVITQGSFQVVPLPGTEEGTVAGFGLEIDDKDSGIVVVAMMGHPEAEGLGKALLAACEGTTPAAVVVLAPASMADGFKRGRR